ncbi:MAG: nitroreductase family deazaflavin-dependent oxidoreductase [Chloroflexota bacterium]
MTDFTPRPRIWHKAIKKIAATSFGSWLLAGNLHRLDRPVLRLTKGRANLTSLLAGLPVVVLTAKGARSRLPRTLPLAAIQDGSRLVLIASSFGKAQHPSWYYNLKANPDAEVQINGATYPCTARQAEGAEREEYWKKAVEMYTGYARYADKANRQIPVIVLEVDGLS